MAGGTGQDGAGDRTGWDEMDGTEWTDQRVTVLDGSNRTRWDEVEVQTKV